MTGKLSGNFDPKNLNSIEPYAFMPKHLRTSPIKVGDKCTAHFWFTPGGQLQVIEHESGTYGQKIDALPGWQLTTGSFRARTLGNVQIPGVTTIDVLVNGTQAASLAWNGDRYQDNINGAAVRALIEADANARAFSAIAVTGVA